MENYFKAKFFTMVFALLVGDSFASWLWLGTGAVGTVTPQNLTVCNNVPGLTFQQRSLCTSLIIPSLSDAAKLAITECQRQFRKERWNCGTVDSPTVFGGILKIGSRETAFLHAIISAALVHSVSRSCSSGNLIECACDSRGLKRLVGPLSSRQRWSWSGCDDNINYGVWFSQTFVDPVSHRKRRSRKMMGRLFMNKHNNKAGREAVKSQMVRQCKCHGVSGSCTTQSCRKSAPNFKIVGNLLKRSYESAAWVFYSRVKNKLRRRKKQKHIKIQHTDLVYIESSPNYCERNTRLEIPGTSSRICNKTSDDGEFGSCSRLCCGRGYNTIMLREEKNCKCKFVWCCKVNCEICQRLYESQRCK